MRMHKLCCKFKPSFHSITIDDGVEGGIYFFGLETNLIHDH